MDQKNENILKQTQSAFIWTRILGVPFWGLVNLLSIILYKDMHISALQITAILAIKPMSAILAPYWSQMIYQRSDRLISNLVWSNILRFVPFLFIPWIDSAWVIIGFFGLYMMLYRGAIPAWMETFKQNIPTVTRERVLAYGSAIDYCATAVLPFLMGGLLDGYTEAWRWLFPMTAVLGLLSTWFLSRIPTVSAQATFLFPDADFNFKEQIIKPWKQSWDILRENRYFANFQIGFMLGGTGLMVMQPALPAFFVDVLDLSYTKVLVALTVCKGIGFAITSPFWSRLFSKIDIYYFSGLVTTLAALFPFLLLSAQYHIFLLYGAYLLYGVMQAGSELSWHMSGPHFANEEDSSAYSGTNVLMVGIRGCVAPFLGAALYSVTNSFVIMMLGSLFCIMATQRLLSYSKAAVRAT